MRVQGGVEGVLEMLCPVMFLLQYLMLDSGKLIKTSWKKREEKLIKIDQCNQCCPTSRENSHALVQLSSSLRSLQSITPSHSEDFGKQTLLGHTW